MQRYNYIQWNVSSTTIIHGVAKGVFLEKVMCLESLSEKHQHQQPTLTLISTPSRLYGAHVTKST